MSVRLRRTPRKNVKRGKLPQPLPEAIDGGEWDIKQSGHRRDGLAELLPGGGGRLTIPLGGGETERAMRVHEQMHAAITPRDPEAWDGVDEIVLQLCEDRRVHQGMRIQGFQDQLTAMGELADDMAIEWRRLGEDYQRAMKARDKAGRSLKVIPPRAIVGARVMAAYGTGLWDAEWLAAKKLDPEAAKMGHRLAEELSGPTLCPFEEAKIAAELLCEMFGTPGDPDTSQEGDPPPPPPLMPNPLYSSGSYIKALTEMKEEEKKAAGGKPSLLDEGTPGVFWGDMKIVEKPKPLRLNGRLRGGVRKVPDIRGRALRRVSRLAQDGRVFRAKHHVRRRGGAVLIDCSGSMSLSAEDVQAVMIALPASVIATYNGQGDKGELWIVAREGKRSKTEELHPPYGANVVDVPALKWLNEQKGPRYWVSDGIVTEKGDNHTPRVVAACHLLAKQGNVVRVPDVEAVLNHEGWERV